MKNDLGKLEDLEWEEKQLLAVAVMVFESVLFTLIITVYTVSNKSQPC